MDIQWCYIDGEEQIGPISHEEMVDLIKGGKVFSRTKVCDSEAKEWEEALFTRLASSFAGLPWFPPPLPSVSYKEPESKRMPFGTVIPGDPTYGITSIPWRYAELCATPFLAPLRFAMNIREKKKLMAEPRTWFFWLETGGWIGPLDDDAIMKKIEDGVVTAETMVWNQRQEYDWLQTADTKRGKKSAWLRAADSDVGDKFRSFPPRLPS